MTGLVLFDAARSALAQAKSVDELKLLRDQAQAMQTLLKAQGAGREMQNDVAEIRLRVERRLGEMLAAVERSNGGRPAENSSHDGTGFRSFLKESEIPPMQAHRWQTEAAVPEEIFERHVAETLARPDGELTSAGLVKLAKETVRDDRMFQRAAAQAAALEEPRQLDLRHGDFREALTDIPDGSVHVIITDPPYAREHLQLYEDLAWFASEKLRPGGSCIVMCGQSYLPDVLRLMVDPLTYHWCAAYLTPGGQSSQLWARRVNTFWKPLLWLTNGEYDGPWVGDVCRSAVNDNDKRFHEWGQSESGMSDIVERFSQPGELVVDPFLGGGTTGSVALRMGRDFIGCDADSNAVERARARLAAESQCGQ